MSSSKLILVTGISGFLGSHVVDNLVANGYRVRGTVRTKKVTKNQKALNAVYGTGRVEVVGIDDLVAGDFSSALEGVSGIVHVASPMIGSTDPKSNIMGAVGGTLNVVRQGYKAGVRSFSVASSIAACIGCDESPRKLTENDWNNDTEEQALDGTRNSVYVYFVSKALAEKALRSFNDEKPESVIVTLNPSYFLGPHAPAQIITPGDVGALSTNLLLYNILFPNSKAVTPDYGFVDVRDVAAALVAGLKQTESSRNLLASDHFELFEAVDHVAEVHPELQDRLAKLARARSETNIDSTNAVKRLGITLTKWKDTVTDTIDSLIKTEKDWGAAGVDVDTVLGKNSFRR